MLAQLNGDKICQYVLVYFLLVISHFRRKRTPSVDVTNKLQCHDIFTLKLVLITGLVFVCFLLLIVIKLTQHSTLIMLYFF